MCICVGGCGWVAGWVGGLVGVGVGVGVGGWVVCVGVHTCTYRGIHICPGLTFPQVPPYVHRNAPSRTREKSVMGVTTSTRALIGWRYSSIRNSLKSVRSYIYYVK